MRGPHTHAARGTPVIIVLKDGTRFEAHFHERRSRYIEFGDHARVESGKVRSMMLRKLGDQGRPKLR